MSDRSRDPDAPARDAALIRLARRGAETAGEELGQRLLVIPRLVREVDRRRGRFLSHHDLDDLSQDILLIVWKKLDQFGGWGTLEDWLYRICQLEYMNRLRVLARRSSRDQLSPTPPDSVVDPDDPGRQEQSERIEQALCGLPAVEEEVVRMKHYEGLTFDGISRRTGTSPNTIKARYYRGLSLLRRRLAELDGDRE